MKNALKNEITQYVDNAAGFDRYSYNEVEKSKLLAYMKSFEPYSVAGLVCDCISGENLSDENLGYTDGEFLWCSQDIYHIEKYNARVSTEFLEKIKQ